MLATLVLVPAAQADRFPPTISPTPPLPGMAQATDPRAHGLQGAALAYWRHQGISTCPGGVEFFYADMTSSGLADVGGCWAATNGAYVKALRDARGRAERRFFARAECGLWAHEIGHALGLEHDDAGQYPIMDEYADASPPECWRAARSMYPPAWPARTRHPRV